jgi:hypothetical protein
LLRAGDLLVRSIASPVSERLVLAEWPSEAPDACAASTVLVLRPREDVTSEQLRVARQYLTSRLAMEVVRAMSGGSPNVAPTLRRILVPVPDADLDLAIRDLDGAAMQFRRWADEAEHAASDLFERVDPERWRAQVLRAGSRVRERERAALQVEDLGFRIRTLFPHPLAYSWRVVEASRADYDGYKTVLETHENTMAYIAIIALTVARAVDEAVPYLSVTTNRLQSSPDKGMNLGDWYSILIQVRDNRSLGDLEGEIAVPELMALWRDSETQGALNRLKSRRDDDGHIRRPEDGEMESAYLAARSDLEWVLDGADFLVDYPLRLIEATRWREIVNAEDYDYRDLRGDHPLVPLEHGQVEAQRLEPGSLYVGTRRDRLFKLSPALVRASCPHCRAPATFCFDKLDRETRAPVFRALEHRHTAVRPDLADELKAIGLVPN